MASCQHCKGPVEDGVCLNCGQAAASANRPGQDSTRTTTPSQMEKDRGPLIFITVTIVAAVVIATFSFLVWVLTQEEQKEALVFEMTATNEADVEYNREFSGEDATQLREEMDIDGDHDGWVSPGEVRDYEERIEGLVNGLFMSSYLIDFRPGLGSQCDISYQGADGNVQSEQVIRERTTLKVNWTFLDPVKSWYVTEIWAYSLNGEAFRYVPPPGYEVVDVGGLENERYNGDGNAVHGRVTGDHIYITTSRIEGGGLGDTEPNDDTSDASPILDGAVIEGELIDASDVEDFYYIVLDSGDEVEVTLDGPDNTDFDVFLYRYFPAVLKSGTSDDSDEFLYYQAESAGIYFIGIVSNADTGSYTLSVEVN